MEDKRLLLLLNKYRDNICTDEELQELEQWYHTLNTGNQPIEDTHAFADEMLLQFREKFAAQKQTTPLHQRMFFRVAAAAVIIIALGVGGYFTFFDHPNNQGPITGNNQPDIQAPNTTKAFITFSDGRKVYLDSPGIGSLTTEGNINVVKLDDGKIAYTGSPAAEIKYNTLTVPKGSKPFKLLLTDGTEIWLDAATTISYPNAFIGKERKVELVSGQAYFEVTHNSAMPFSIRKGDVEVAVLGTHFNIEAFDDEPVVKVTLLEGSVKVNKGLNSVRIKPGQQAVANSNINIVSADIDEVMAWKNGNFQFEGADINIVMKQLARWYDVEVKIEGNIPAHFGGTISRGVSVSKVFEMLKMTGEVNYKIEGRKIIVTP